MPVRDVEWYGRPRHGLRVLANRGANGIDGVLSTALGVALAAPGVPLSPCSGTWPSCTTPARCSVPAVGGSRCTVVVVDNDGGGIFSFLPQASAVAPGPSSGCGALRTGSTWPRWQRPTASPPSGWRQAERLGPAVARAVAAGGVRAVVVRTDRAANVAVHDELHAAVAEAVEAAGLG